MSSSQGYAIELYFDPALENQVLKSWNVMARRQLSTQLIEIESRPHITLISFPHNHHNLDPLKLEPLLKSTASKFPPLQLTLSAISLVEGTSVTLSPTPTIPLLQLHSHLCDLLIKEGVEVPDKFRVDHWAPVCPVALDVPKPRVAEAFAVLRDLKLPVSGYAVDVGLVEFAPVREVCSFMLGAAAGGTNADA